MGLGPQITMQVAERLYTQGFIRYSSKSLLPQFFFTPLSFSLFFSCYIFMILGNLAETFVFDYFIQH